MKIVQGLMYSKDHEWVRLEGETAYVGITDYAQNALGDIVYVEMPAVGDEIDPQAQIGVLESVKAVAELYSPVGGTVTAVNDEVEATPELLNSDPYGCHIIVLNVSEVPEDLMDAQAYGDYLKTLD